MARNFVRVLLLLGSLLPQLGRAQGAAAACGGGRYVADTFPTVQTTVGVEFGRNTAIDYSTGQESAPLPLYLDFYEPAGDAAAQRPLLILAFGGSFVTGTRQDADIVAICQAFARKGYATAAIDYRLVQPGAKGLNYALLANRPDLLADELVRAANDLRAAVRFFRAMTSTYRIDPAKVFVGGFSAGAITALQVGYTETVAENSDLNIQKAYARYGGLEGNTDLPGNGLLGTYNSQNVAGVFNIAGGINDLSLLSAGNPPLYSAQGTRDEVVPYDCGSVSYSNYALCGGNQLQMRALSAEVNLTSRLYPVVGGTHSSPASEPNRSLVIADAAAFLQTLICPAAPLPVTLSAFGGRVDAHCAATLSWQTASEVNSRAYEVQGSDNGLIFNILTTVPSRNQLAGAAYTCRLGTMAGTRYFRLRLVDADGTAAYSPLVTLTAACGPANGLATSPNPIRNILIINNLQNERSTLLVYDATGRLVLRAHADQATASLAIGDLPPGIYFLKAYDEAGLPVGSAKVVKE